MINDQCLPAVSLAGSSSQVVKWGKNVAQRESYKTIFYTQNRDQDEGI